MVKHELNKINDAELIYCHGEYIIFSGKTPRIFLKDGTYIAINKKIKKAYEMVFLGQNKVLMDGRGDGFYHLVSLENGEVLWSIPKKGRRYYSPCGFFSSRDKKTVCYVYWNKEDLSLDYFDLEKGSISTHRIPGIKGAVYRGYCQNDGLVFLLRLVYENTQKLDSFGDHITQQKVDIFSFDPVSSTVAFKNQWVDNNAFSDMVCCFDEEYILLNNLYAVKICTSEVVDLIENGPQIQRPNGGLSVVDYDYCSKMLTVRLTASCSTLIIDCNERKIVSHYTPISCGLSGGALIDGEFWIGTDKGICKRPFPNMDSFPKKLLQSRESRGREMPNRTGDGSKPLKKREF